MAGDGGPASPEVVRYLLPKACLNHAPSLSSPIVRPDIYAPACCCSVALVDKVHYIASSGSTWGEHEIDYVFLIQADVDLDPNPNEVTCWVSVFMCCDKQASNQLILISRLTDSYQLLISTD